MAQNSSKSPLANKVLGVSEMQNGIKRIEQRLEELAAFDPRAVDDGDDPKLQTIETSIKQTLSDIFGHNTADWDLFAIAANLDPAAQGRGYKSLGSSMNGDGFYRRGAPQYKADVVESVIQGKERSEHLLRQAIAGLKERMEYRLDNTPASRSSEVIGNEIFLVHGHDVAARESVARFLEKIGFKPVILHEQANKGRTIIEKFEAHSDVGFAVVLLTPDDMGSAISGVASPRARQNVILELGYFIGRLGRDRVCALKSGSLELPSDIVGVVWTEFDAAGGWKVELGNELSAAGYNVDWNKVMVR